MLEYVTMQPHSCQNHCSFPSSTKLSKHGPVQEANNRAAPSSPGRAARQPLASTCANAQQHVRKRNAAAKKKLQEDLAEQTALVEKLQQQLEAVQIRAHPGATQARLVMPRLLGIALICTSRHAFCV